MIYCWICDACGSQKEVSRSMAESSKMEFCSKCGTFMRRDYPAEHASTRGDYNEPIVMQSMAIHPDDAAKYRSQFPNHELVGVPGGFVAPVARSLTEKRRILKDRGWHDKRAYY
jgi:hypothetical protein